jgi:hypothetical protein
LCVRWLGSWIEERTVVVQGLGAQWAHPVAKGGVAAVASFLAAVWTEIYLCNICSCQTY